MTSGSAESQLNVDNRNRITGSPTNCTAANAYCYDAAGDLLNDNFHQYTYNAESQIAQVDGGAATYTYDAERQRVRKTVASGSTQYLYFAGSIIAEKNLSTGDWTDHIFANGKHVAQAFSVACPEVSLLAEGRTVSVSTALPPAPRVLGSGPISPSRRLPEA